MSRTRFEPAREVPLTPTELTYLARVVDRDLAALRNGKDIWSSPSSMVFVERLQTKLSRALNRQDR